MKYIHNTLYAKRYTLCAILIALFCLILPQTTQAATTNQISQFGITWTFDKEYEYGTFANGDYWVVGPVTIIAIDPPSTDIDGRVINGAMLDPVASLGKPGPEYGAQGLDSSLADWNSSLNVGRPDGNDLSEGNPLVIEPNHSLVSAISGAAVGARLTDAAVLTILASAPEPNSFRPAYAGTDKSIKFNVSDLDYSSLGSLTPVASAPSLATAEGWFERPWPDWQQCVETGLHASNNMPGYGADVAARIGQGALVLQLNYTNAQKETLMIRFVQLGIDLYGILINNGNRVWEANGGFANGRKLPILFAGLVLDDANMKGIGSKSGDYLYEGEYGPGNIPPDYYHFGEDDDTFYVEANDVYSQPYELKYTAFTATSGSITGHVKVTADSNIVEGVGTNWSSIIYGPDDYLSYSTKKMFGVKNDAEAYLAARPYVMMGDYWVPDYIIKSIDSDTQITLNKPYHGDTNETGNAEYAISKTVTYGHGDDKYIVDGDEYEDEHLGMPEWGGRHVLSYDNAHLNWGSNYRGTAGKVFASLALPAHIVGLKTLWNHNAFFDYTDRYMQVMVEEANRTFGEFEADMWDEYRADYGCIWTRDDPTDIYSNGFNPCALEIIGDVNADGEISAFDAALAAHIAVDLEHPDIKNRAAAEVSGDGEVTAYDAALIAQRAVGLIEKFPAEG